MRGRGFFALYSMFRLFEMVQRQRYYSQRNRQRTVQPIQPMSDADIEKRYVRLSGRRVHNSMHGRIRAGKHWQHASPEAVRTAALFWLAVIVILLLLTIVVNMPVH